MGTRKHRRVCAVALAGAILLSHGSPSDAVAQTPQGTQSRTEDQGGIEAGAWPVLAALLPGVILHGSGHFVGHDRDTAGRLLAVEGVGLGGVLLGGGVLVASGSSRKIAVPAIALLSLGAGLFAQSWLADVWGAATGGRGLGEAREELAHVELLAGYRYIYDPQFDYRHFAGAGAHIRFGRARIAPEIWTALHDRNQRARLRGGYRLLGPPRTSGSFLSARGAVDYHNFGADGFAVLTAEAALRGRYDLATFSRSTRGAFAELSLGWAVQFYDYDAPGRNLGADVVQMLLSRIAFGLYLGRGDPGGGEVLLYYDHRRDGWLGGLATDGGYAGTAGRFGVRGHYYFTAHWGATGELAYGSAVLAGAGLRYRWGGA